MAVLLEKFDFAILEYQCVFPGFHFVYDTTVLRQRMAVSAEAVRRTKLKETFSPAFFPP
jgi:hypothetical protein